MWREWCVVICFCLSVSNEAASAHHKKQTNSTVATTPAVSGGNLSSTVQGWLLNYWYVLVVVLLVLMVTSIFACACVVKKARRNPTHYQVDATSTRSAPPLTHPFSRPPLSSVVDGSLSPGMVSMDQSPVPSPQPSYSSQQSQRSSGRSTTYKKKRTLSPGQNSSGSEETIRSDKGMLRVPWQQQMTPDSMMKLSISGMAQHNSTSLPEAISMLSVRSNHSGRSSHSARSGHTHSDALSQKAVVEEQSGDCGDTAPEERLGHCPGAGCPEEEGRRGRKATTISPPSLERATAKSPREEGGPSLALISHCLLPLPSTDQVDVKLHLSPDQEQDARRMTAAALAESARQLARSAARLGEEEEPYQVFSHSPPRTYYQSRVASSQVMREPLPPQRDVSAGRVAMPLTTISLDRDRAVNTVTLDHPVYSLGVQRGRHGYLTPASPLTAHRSVGSDTRRSFMYPTPSHSPTKLSSSGLGSLDRPHTHSPTKLSSSGLGSLDRPHPHSPTKLSSSGLGSLDRPHPHSPTKLSSSGLGSLDRPHPHSPTKLSSSGLGSLDRPHPYSPGKGSNLGLGSLDRPHPHSPTRTLRPGVGSLDKVNRSSSGLQRARVPSVSSERFDRVPWRYGDARSHDPLRQFYEQDGHTGRTSQDTPPGYRQTGVGCRDYSTIDADGVDVDTIDMENVAATQHQNCSLGHHCCGDDVRLYTLPHHYITSASQDSRTSLSFGQLSHGVARSNHDSMQLHLQDRENVALETRVTKRQSESCAEDSGIQTTSFSEEHFHLPPSPCCSSSAPSVEEEPQVVHTETVVCEKQQSLLTAHQHTPPTSSHQMVALPRSNSGLSADEQLSTASGYAATGSASSIDTGSNGPPSQPNQFQLEPRIVRRTSHSGVTPCDLASPAGVHEWDPSSPDLTPREKSHGHDIVVPQSKGKGNHYNHHSISNNWMQQPVIKYSNHGDQESISVDI